MATTGCAVAVEAATRAAVGTGEGAGAWVAAGATDGMGAALGAFVGGGSVGVEAPPHAASTIAATRAMGTRCFLTTHESVSRIGQKRGAGCHR